MHIAVIGGGPVGLLTAFLLSSNHTVTIYEKRQQRQRHHTLSLDKRVLTIIKEIVADRSPILTQLLNEWSLLHHVTTNTIESELTTLVLAAGVTIIYKEIIDITTIPQHIIIGADGAKSKIRELFSSTTDSTTMGYMAQVKFSTPGTTSQRSIISSLSHYSLNSVTTKEIGLDFESLAPPSNDIEKMVPFMFLFLPVFSISSVVEIEEIFSIHGLYKRYLMLQNYTMLLPDMIYLYNYVEDG